MLLEQHGNTVAFGVGQQIQLFDSQVLYLLERGGSSVIHHADQSGNMGGESCSFGD
jgi:hypothetical protein